MPVTPTDELAVALDNLRHSVAASSAFQTWTTTADETAALAKVYAGEAPGAGPFPCAVAWLQRWGAIRSSTGAKDEFEATGSLMLELIAEVETGDRSDAYVDMLNRVGAVRADVLALSGTAKYLSCESFNVKGVVRFEDPTATARGMDVWVAQVEISVRP